MLSRTCSARAMPTTPTSKSTVFATIAAADALPRVKPRCAWPLALLLKKYLQQKFGIVIRGCLTQMGDIPLAIKDWDQVSKTRSSALMRISLTRWTN